MLVVEEQSALGSSPLEMRGFSAEVKLQMVTSLCVVREHEVWGASFRARKRVCVFLLA